MGFLLRGPQRLPDGVFEGSFRGGGVWKETWGLGLSIWGSTKAPLRIPVLLELVRVKEFNLSCHNKDLWEIKWSPYSW